MRDSYLVLHIGIVIPHLDKVPRLYRVVRCKDRIALPRCLKQLDGNRSEVVFVIVEEQRYWGTNYGVLIS